MKIQPITSSDNSLLKTIRSLHDRHGREKSGLFLIEGSKAVGEALAKKLAVQDIIISQTQLQNEPDNAAWHQLDYICVVEDKLFKEMSTTVTPEGVMAVAQMPKYSTAELFTTANIPLIVVAHAIQDPGNLGTIIRTALAASVTGIILTEGTVDPFNPKVVRAAAGALFALPVVCGLSLEEAVFALKRQSINVIACQQTARKKYFDADLRQPSAFILGNEGQGLSESDLSLADEVVSIPMNEQSESLNVAVSGAIVLFSAVQQRLSARG